ncbi:hypothetical protein BDV18DRAFT_142954 [Aspergillus unguis]
MNSESLGLTPTSPQYRATVARPARNRRASKACLNCHSRKVRCDMTLRSPQPCTNCELDNIVCTVSKKKRTRRKIPPAQMSPEQAPELLPVNPTDLHAMSPRSTPQGNSVSQRIAYSDHLGSATSAMPTSIDSISMENCTSPVRDNESINVNFNVEMQNQDTGIQAPLQFDGQLSSLDLEYDGCQQSHSTAADKMSDFEQLDNQTLSNIFSMTFEDFQGPWQCITPSTTCDTNTTTRMAADCCCIPACSSPVKWVAAWCTSHLDKTTVARIASSGALSAPSEETLNVFLRYYFQFKQALLPVLSEWELYCLLHDHPVDEGEPAQPISLALFNAILFSASSLATKAEAVREGFDSVRAMRGAFYTRAKILYEAGCESDSLAKVQICLLLAATTYPNFDNGEIPAENWMKEAQLIFKEANVPDILSRNFPPSRKKSRWRVLYSCCSMRILCCILGSRRPTVLPDVPLEAPCVSPADLQDDLRVSWHLSVEVKQKLLAILLARMDLFRHIITICNIIAHRSQRLPSAASYPKRSPTYSIIGELEECESSISEWRTQYYHLFHDGSESPQLHGGSDLSLLTHRLHLELSYEFTVSVLHQVGIAFGSSKMTPWARKLREASHQALLESTMTTTKIVQQLMSWDILRYLPSVVVSCIFIPFTMYSVFVKVSTSIRSFAVHGLSTCLLALQSLYERYDDVDSFMSLHQATLSLLHRKMLDKSLCLDQSSRTPYTSHMKPFMDDDKLVFSAEQSDTYLYVLKFHAQTIAKGLIEDTPPTQSGV